MKTERIIWKRAYPPPELTCMRCPETAVNFVTLASPGGAEYRLCLCAGCSELAEEELFKLVFSRSHIKWEV